MTVSTETTSSSRLGIRIIVQRYSYASIVIDDNQLVQVGQRNHNINAPSLLLLPNNKPIGLLVFISFSNVATEAMIEKAAKTVLNLPIMSETGVWGDGTATDSMLDILLNKTKAVRGNKDKEKETIHTGMSMIIVPQANLICKIKQNGKSIQYHDQCPKEKGLLYYQKFCDTMETLLIEHEHYCLVGKRISNRNNKKAVTLDTDPTIPPNELFTRNNKNSDGELLYATFDKLGIPLTLNDGGKVSKNAQKKFLKQYNAQQKRYDKYLLETKDAATTVTSSNTTKAAVNKQTKSFDQLSPTFLQLIRGSFGKRQALEFQSDMGPFSHVVEI